MVKNTILSNIDSDLAKKTQIVNNQLDLFCYYNYAVIFTKISKQNQKLATILAPIFIRDLSVYLFETVKLYKNDNNPIINNIINNEFYKDLKYIRNRIKLYKKGGNEKEIKNIINIMQTKYKTKPKDILYFRRKDTSIFFQDQKKFIGSDFFFYYVFGNLHDKFEKHGYEILMHFAFYISNSITLLYMQNITDGDKKNLSEEFFKENDKLYISIKLTDYKIDKIMKKSKFSEVITFQSILIIYEISYIEILLSRIIDIPSMLNPLSIYFIVKIISIKFDEIFDTIFNIINHMNQGKKFEKLLVEQKVLPISNKTKNFAKNLRNNLHYVEYDWNVKKGLVDIENLFSKQANVDDWKKAYFSEFDNMTNILIKLASVLREKVIKIK